ncbi:MAG: TonB-dependent siderophore myxochelin receptor MxcH [Sandaracinaceae bacterium]|nr:TonB-dependent siderophore myxochelin receptor MxcH [Sandaracinaceae bacterium]
MAALTVGLSLLSPRAPAPALAQGTPSQAAPEAAPETTEEAPAPAPDEQAPAAAPEPAVVPPRLIQFVEADYPPEALAAGVAGRVVLRLTIDAEGTVTEAEIMVPMGHGLSEAAQAAALRFRFEPARQHGVTVASRILYAYEFTLPAAPEVGDVRGQVQLPGTAAQAAVGVSVTLRTAEGHAYHTRTDTEGAFRFDALPVGEYQLEAHGDGLGHAELSVFVAAGEPATPSLRLLRDEHEAPIEVTVRGASEAQRMRESAQAVHVIETEQAQQQTADLGEVLARSQGIGVRRGGGLGSGTRFSLNGLTDDQIRFFVDGVPLEFAGYPFGISNIPVNLVERVEVYRGVVPIRFGADALGGAVNLVSQTEVEGSHVAASYQAGSFGTHRLSLGGHHLHAPSGFFTRVGAFLDYAENDYPVDVAVPDSSGRPIPARAHRFHDGYRARGANLELGFVDRPWADRLLLRAFVTDYDKELQNNVVMTVPYGDVTYGEVTTGASLRFEHRLSERVSLDAVAGYAYTSATFVDVGTCVYNWFGQCVRERRQAGEIETPGRDQRRWEHNAFARANVQYRPRLGHTLRLSLSPTYATRTGHDRQQTNPDARDPLTAERRLTTLVTGLEYEADLLDERFEGVLFVKDYVQRTRSEEAIPGGTFRRYDRDTHRVGFGSALRYRFAEWLYAKGSYEWATRLPRPDEIFGDGVLVIANLELRPEQSHNVNLGLTLNVEESPAGAFRADVNLFLRRASELIVLLGNDRTFSYENVFGARSMGVEASAGWTSPGEYVVLDGNVTYVDMRNTSRNGTFGDFAGDRIPNRPYLFANGTARLQVRGVAAPNDELALTWSTRYVHAFFRGWESVGLRDFKQVIEAQVLHSLGLVYVVRGDVATVSFTGEVQNLTDAPAFDFFGVQRPGRAFYFKTTAEF